MRILIADDNEQVRNGVTSFLSADPTCEVCGEAASGEQAMQMVRELAPDVVLLDVSMPGLSGLETARLLRPELPNVKIIMMSQHDPVQLLPQALDAGADACVDKCCVTTDLMPAIRSVTGNPEGIRI
ncbi:MAG TPA: response regulator transcription factor [Candidatus Acidoferrales bacterium]|jgi:DNA-binding NarL/FixJ family response regulator|nr:response regulator transcription factor [Candidatus Acidoferrales bacterium]